MKAKELKDYEQISYQLICSDLKDLGKIFHYLYSKNTALIPPLFPYIGLISNESYRWSQNIGFLKENVPKVKPDTKEHIKDLREHLKYFEDLKEINMFNHTLHNIFNEFKNYPPDKNLLLKFIYKFLITQNVYHVAIVKEEDQIFAIDNTINSNLFLPKNYYDLSRDYSWEIGNYLGELLAYFLGDSAYDKISSLSKTNNTLEFATYDFGFDNPLPFNGEYNDKFLLFSVICNCNYVIHVINKIIVEETPLKLRVTYLLYYYLYEILYKLNKFYEQNWTLNDNWICRRFRNCMAHYGLGIELRNDVNQCDEFGGLSDKKFGIPWQKLYFNIEYELRMLSKNFEKYLDSCGYIHQYKKKFMY